MGFLAGVLATLGLVVILLAALAVITGRRFRAAGGTFRCRVRMLSGGRRRKWPRWPLHRTHARWIHDVLVLRSGPLGLASLPVAARIAPGAVLRPVPATKVRRLGERPWALLLTTEARVAMDVAVAEADRDLLVGPYLAASLDGLPSAPHESGTER